jgi:hypothetical protein
MLWTVVLGGLGTATLTWSPRSRSSLAEWRWRTGGKGLRQSYTDEEQGRHFGSRTPTRSRAVRQVAGAAVRQRQVAGAAVRQDGSSTSYADEEQDRSFLVSGEDACGDWWLLV